MTVYIIEAVLIIIPVNCCRRLLLIRKVAKNKKVSKPVFISLIKI